MITFDEKAHTYTLDDGRTLISVTQLMKKHGLATDYSGVRSEVLARAADRGTLIHKEIEDFCKRGEIGFTPEMMTFRDYMNDHKLYVSASETIVHDDLIAGTIDLLFGEIGANGQPEGDWTIADIKTTASLNRDAVSWQLSLYNYLLGYQIGYTASKAQAFHFSADGSLKVVDIPFKPQEEVERLLDCERRGVIYEKPNAVEIVTDQQVAAIAEAEEIIAAAKEAEKKIAEIKNAILLEMERRGIKSCETDRVRLTYVDAYEKTGLDGARLKKEHPEIAEAYQKTTRTAPSLRITIK